MSASRKHKAPAAAGSKLRTPEQVRDEFDRTGTTVSGWATAHGFTPSLVFEVLEGRVKGKRGKGHKIAVLLGLKSGEVRA